MRKLVFVCIGILSFISWSLQAQEGRHGADFEKKYHSQKVAYLTTEMDLSPDESAAFWPLYNAHDKEMASLKDDIKGYRNKISKMGEGLTEEDALEALNNYQDKMGEMHQIQVDYQVKYLQVIPAKKVIIMLRAEKEFRRGLLRELGDKRKHQNRRKSTDQE